MPRARVRAHDGPDRGSRGVSCFAGLLPYRRHLTATKIAGVSTEETSKLDLESQRWVDQLSDGHARREQTIGKLHEVLVRVAVHELGRRRSQLGSIAGPEFDDLAHQAADDALVSILAKLDEFQGLSRFTTWAYKFVMFEISSKVARHAWQRQRPSSQDLTWEQLPDTLAPGPGDQLDRRQQLATLSTAIGELSDRQRTVFVAIALNDVPIDVLALALGSNRNAVYKNLFDARRRLRAALAACGHPVEGDTITR
jgi:RNA polymerase sigma-70 factor, ECF subfamily